ncbi:MAG: hypothetical protein GDA56_31580 [Hormoscilla sp. GM7CHS1pb]|nr:hypothetical protein [Hormoscilla sp. GM7CHS1pb]
MSKYSDISNRHIAISRSHQAECLPDAIGPIDRCVTGREPGNIVKILSKLAITELLGYRC